MANVNIKINGMPLSVPEGSTILEAARLHNIRIPTLCYLKEINEIGACRMCLVEVKGARSAAAACVHPVNEGMEIITNSEKIHTSRRTSLELILSTHRRVCLSCVRSGNCELQALCQEYGVENENKYVGEFPHYEIDTTAPHMIRDNSKCILCRRCSAVCDRNQEVGVIGPNNRGFETHIGCAFELGLGEVSCISCGQCINVCPTGALTERDQTQLVWDALNDPTKHVVVQTAPSVRAGLGEEFGMPIGTDVEGKMAASLRRLGFDGVFDTDFSADLTIMEEANELIERVTTGGVLPMITSCSPGWINFCEHYYPEMIPHLSSCKSPQQMFGAMIKTWYANKNNLDPKDIVSVSIMPCTAKKVEAGRDNQSAAGAGIPDVDVALTSRELARMIRRAGLDFVSLPDEDFDNPLGESTGAGVIFGATGGVMEAALRTAVEWISGKSGGPIEFAEVRGTEGIKEASYTVGDLTVNVAVASGLTNAKKVIEMVKSGEKQYHFIEFMACPGGCVNGGGQPIQPGEIRNTVDIRTLRAGALYRNDSAKSVRRSHENSMIKKVYDEFLEKPGSHVAHKVLHTKYTAKTRF